MYTDEQIMQQMRQFIMTYPNPTPFSFLDIFYGAILLDMAGTETNILQFVNRLTVLNKQNIVRGGRKTERINFAIKMYRDTNNNENIATIMNFINDFIRWVNNQQEIKSTNIPAFGENYIINADGGGQTAKISESRAEFTVSLHYDFQFGY